MLVRFKSKAAAEVLMYEEHAKQILDLLNKDVKQGIITAAETPQAVARLEEEIAESRQRVEEARRDEQAAEGKEEDEEEAEPVEQVSFATRVYPFLEMLRAAKREGKDVVWGV